MRIDSSNTKRPCTSCQMCAAVCPKDAITIKLDNNGFYRPFVDNEKCVDCNLCTNVCYKFDEVIAITSDEQLKQISLYSASAKNYELVAQTTSGGIADILAKELIDQGYKVIGVAYDYDNNIAKHRIASSKSETDVFKGSKYIQSYTFNAFKYLVANCRNEKIAVFGLPCHIYAISMYLTRSNLRGNCILIDLYCHGCPSMHVWEKMVIKIKKNLNVEQIDYVNFRSKRNGWGQFVIEARSGKKIYHSSPLHNEFYDLFFSNQVLNESCIDCILRSTLEYTDIRIGDFWGKKFKKNNKGVSAISLVTQTGFSLFEKVKKNLDYNIQDYNIFLPYQSWRHNYGINKKMRERCLNMLSDKSYSIDDVSRLVKSQRKLTTRIKVLIKHSYFFVYSLINRN